MMSGKNIVGGLLGALISATAIGQVQSENFINDFKKDAIDKQIELISPSGELLKVKLESYHEIGNKVSSHGTIVGAEFSNVMVKIDGEKVFGYVLDVKNDKGFVINSDAHGTVTFKIAEPHDYFHIINFKKSPLKELESKQIKPLANITSSLYPHVQKYQPGMDMHALESKPGSPNVLFLDWRDVFNGNTAKNMTNEEMYMVWAGTAAAYTSFDVNVTTSSSVYNSVPITNSCIALFKDHDARSHAPMDSWGTANSSTIYTANQTDWYVNTLVHEIGHQLGLDHDGAPHKEYFEGVSDYDWNSVMGHTWYANFLQYSKGEYKDANNQEDDFALINRYIPYRNFEMNSVKNIVFSSDQSTVDLQNNVGSIERNTDVDTYEITISEPKILNLLVEALEYRTMLDIDATLLSPSGKTVSNSNIILSREAKFENILLDELGTYKLLIKGGAEGTPEWGFSNYSSVGVYGLSGSVRALYDNEVDLVQVDPFEQVCNSYAPSVSIKNMGKLPITDLELEVVVNGGGPQLITKSGLNISSLNESTVQLNELTQIGKDIPLKISVKSINGSSPKTAEILDQSYTLGTGVAMELNIDDIAYPNTTWLIENQSGVKILDYSDVIEEVNLGGENKMRFCLAEDCYNLKISHELESCSNLDQWSSSSNYQAGAKVIHQAKDPDGNFYVYTNKWWASGTNVPGGGDPWVIDGICTGPSRGEFSMKIISDTKFLIEENSNGSTSTQSFEFCPTIVTGKEEIELGNLTVYPNPFNNQINISLENDLIKFVEIFDISGKKIMNSNPVNAHFAPLSIDVKQGVYLLKIIGESGNYSAVITK